MSKPGILRPISKYGPPRLPLIAKTCKECRRTFSFRSNGKIAAQKRQFCDRSCSARWRMAQPAARKRAAGVMTRLHHEGRFPAPSLARRQASSDRMRRDNPVRRPGVLKKIKQAAKGRTFLSRGGNGTPTKPQLNLAQALGWPIEVAIPTRAARGRFKTLPTTYKVDLGQRAMKIAIEVDGRSHDTKKWKFLDARKVSVLEFLGWSVLRVSNHHALTELTSVVAWIHVFMTSKSRTTTTISPRGFSYPTVIK